MIKNCLNCNKEIKENFCSNCSQPTSTHRFSLSHVFQHDFIHGIFHFDKGFFFTIKELFTRPGHSIREYVQGKRIIHFNYFSTIIILLTVSYFLKKWTKIDAANLYEKEMVVGLFKVQKNYSKIVACLHIPIIALFSYLLFRRSKQNYIENIVVNLYLLCGILTLRLFFPISMIITDNKELLLSANYLLTILTLFYVIIFYYQYFSAFDLKRYKLIIRVIIFAFLYLFTQQFTYNIINFIGMKYLH